MTLTKRHIEVLIMAAVGGTNQEIAHALGISETTTKNHMYELMQRLGAKNRTHAVAILYEAAMQGSSLLDLQRLPVGRIGRSVEQTSAVVGSLGTEAGLLERWLAAISPHVAGLRDGLPRRETLIGGRDPSKPLYAALRIRRSRQHCRPKPRSAPSSRVS